MKNFKEYFSSKLNEGHDGTGGILKKAKNKNDAIEILKGYIEDDDSFKKFRDIYDYGEVEDWEDEGPDKKAQRLEDNKIVLFYVKSDKSWAYCYWTRS